MFRRAASAIPVWAWSLLAVLVPFAVLTVIRLAEIPPTDGHLVGVGDPDPWLRLTLVRHWLQGGSWYDHSYLSNAPFGGTVSPWTRPLDVVIAALAKLQPAHLGLTTQLLRTSMLLPLLWMALLLGGMVDALKRLQATPATCFFAVMLVACATTLWGYFIPGNADHHAPLAALWVWASSLTMLDASARQRALGGALLGLMLWINPEALPLIAAVYAWHGVRWLRGGHDRSLAIIATSVALTAAAALVIERPRDQWLLPIYDTISIVHVFLLMLCAVLAFALQRVRGGTGMRLAVAAFGSCVVLGSMQLHYPLFFHGPMATVEPFILKRFLPSVNEAKSPFTESWPTILALLLQPLLAMAVCAIQIRRDGVIRRDDAARLLYLTAIACALYSIQQRWFYYLQPIAALGLAPWLAALMQPHPPSRWPASWIGRFSSKGQALRRIPIVIGIFALPIALGMWQAAHVRANTAHQMVRGCMDDARRIIQSGALDTVRPTILFAHSNLGAEILFFTHHRIIASNYHREGKGIEYLWNAETITDRTLFRRYLAQHAAGALLVCPSVDRPPGSVLDDLYRGRLSLPWLKKVALEARTESENPPVFFLVK